MLKLLAASLSQLAGRWILLPLTVSTAFDQLGIVASTTASISKKLLAKPIHPLLHRASLLECLLRRCTCPRDVQYGCKEKIHRPSRCFLLYDDWNGISCGYARTID